MTRAVQIRGVPNGVHATLRARAAAAGTSLSDYLLREIIEVAERPEVSDVLRRAGERSGGAQVGAVVDEIRKGRERDSG